MARLRIPARVRAAVADPATLLLVSISGGKDGQAMLAAVAKAHRRQGWRCRLEAVHAALGPEVEWPESLPHCHKLCDALGIPLHVVGYEGGLLGRMEKRLISIQAKGQVQPFWPSPSARYCTSDTKTKPIEKLIRHLVPNGGRVVQAIGIRAEESTTRAAKLPCQMHFGLASREAITWHPVLDWPLEEVWKACGTSGAEIAHRRALYASERREEALAGATVHPAYVYGNERVSCVYCIMGSKNDLQTGYREHPEMLDPYLALEARSGYTFKAKWSLRELTT